MIKVSVIVPAYNAEKYLEQCLDSLVRQTLGEIEIVVVNDGSTDGTAEILDRYQAEYPDKVRAFSKENGGQASARNLALRCCRGEYVGYMDADDYAREDMFEKLYGKAKETACELVVCGHYNICGGEQKYVPFEKGDCPRDFFQGVLVSPWNKFFLRETLLRSGVEFPEGYIYEDTAWFMELIPYFPSVARVEEGLLYHVIRENSTMTAEQNERTAQIFPVMQHILDFYRERELFSEYRDELEYFYIRILLCSSLKRISHVRDRKLKKQLLRRTLAECKTNFPHYKKNRFLKGKRGAYIKSMNRVTIRIYSALLGRKK